MEYFEIFDTATFEMVHSVSYDRYDDVNDMKWYADTPKFSNDSSRLLLPFYDFYGKAMFFRVLNTESWEVEFEHFIDPNQDGYMDYYRNDGYMEVTWLPDNSYVLYHMKFPDGVGDYHINVYKYSPEGEEVCYQYYEFPRGTFTSFDVLEAFQTDTHIYYVYKTMVLSVEVENCILEEISMFNADEEIVGYYLQQNEELGLVHYDGSVNFANYPEYEHNIYTACGNGAENEIICLVPEEERNTIIVMQKMKNPDAKEVSAYFLPEDHLFAYNKIYSFPEHHCFLDVVIDFKDEKEEYFFTIYDADTLEEMDRFSMLIGEEIELIRFSRDGKMLLLDEYVYDLESHSLSLCENMEEIRGEDKSNEPEICAADYVNQKPGKPVITAYIPNKEEDYIYWWEDGKNPQSLALAQEAGLGYSEMKVGGNGLIAVNYFNYDYYDTIADGKYRKTGCFICSTNDGSYKYLDRYLNNENDSVIAVGGTKNWVAFADYDWILRIYDYDQDNFIQEHTLPVSPDTIREMLFVAEDKYLLIIQESGLMTVINIADGSVEAQYEIEYNWYWGFNTVFQIDKNDKMLYVCNSGILSEGQKIDIETWADEVKIPGLLCYLEDSNKILQGEYRTDKIIATPVYSLEELIEQANALVSGSLEVE